MDELEKFVLEGVESKALKDEVAMLRGWVQSLQKDNEHLRATTHHVLDLLVSIRPYTGLPFWGGTKEEHFYLKAHIDEAIKNGAVPKETAR